MAEGGRQLPEEMAAIQEVARIITTTLEIDQVYDKFAAEVKKLVGFDRMVINVVDNDAGTFSPTYQAGTYWEARKPGTAIPLDKTLTGMVVDTGRSYLRDDISRKDGSTGDSGRLKAGLRSDLSVPLRNKGQITAVLHLLSLQVRAFGPREQAILERLADQIAPAVEYARLYDQLQTGIEEKAVIDEVARIVTSTLDIGQVYERFAAEVKKLVDFDRINISLIDRDAGTYTVKYLHGLAQPGRRAGDVLALQGTHTEVAMATGEASITNYAAADIRLPADLALLKLGLRSFIMVPLISKGAVIGTLVLHSRRTGAYGEREQTILRRLADQIAPAVENARLYDQLQASAEEKAVVDEVARIITSTLDIDQVYEKFAAEVKKLVGFDRANIVVVDRDSGTYVIKYHTGMLQPGRHVGQAVPLEGSYAVHVMMAGRSVVRTDLATGPSFAVDSALLGLGLRSIISVPTSIQGRVIGTLVLSSRRPGAYGPREQAILEKLADQIAPAVENARLFQVARLEKERTRAALVQLQSVLDTVGEGIITIDANATILLVNREALAIWGYTQEEMVGKSVRILMPPEFQAAHDAGLRRYLDTGVSNVVGKRIELRGLKKDGAAFPLELAVTETEIGEQQCFTASVRDLTERKRAAEALQEGEERFRGIFEESPVGVCLVDEGFRIIEANKAFCRMLGYTEEDLIGGTIADITHPEDVGDSEALLGKTLSGEIPGYETQERYITRSQDIIWVKVTAGAVRDRTGKPVYSLGIVEDITERKSLQEQLVQSQKVEVFGQLAGGVAHDFNNLLTPLLGFSEMASEALAAGEPIDDYLYQVQDAAKRASRLTQQLLAFSRRQIVEPTVVNLNDLVANTERMLRRLIGENIELELHPAPDLGMVKVDTGQMEQVLVNLFVNARDAMPRGGRLTIETANGALDPTSALEFAQLSPGEYVKLSVDDTGVGMDQEVISRLFEPFFTTKEPGRGTGLGLATCYGILKKSGGEIRVRSEPGRGTTFDIYLPRVEGATAPAAEDRRPDEPPRGTETVLLVEDDPSVRFLAAEGLRRQGYTVLEAANGEEALRVGHEHRGEEIALLLTDVVMPPRWEAGSWLLAWNP